MAARKHHEEIEQEVKIRLSREDLEKVFNALSRKYKPKEISHKYLPRAYYDTEEMDFYKTSVSLRVQYKEGEGKAMGGYEQTVKFEITPAGKVAKDALLRKECKDSIGGHEPDLEQITDSEASAVMEPFRGKKLKHIFTAAIERRYFDIKTAAGTVEVAFDVGEIILAEGGERTPFCEIEIEVKKGGAAALEKLCDKILAEAPSAEIQPLSKSQQGSNFYIESAARRKKPGSAGPVNPAL
jgi:inorganic triphosphatase YgiF